MTLQKLAICLDGLHYFYGFIATNFGDSVFLVEAQKVLILHQGFGVSRFNDPVNHTAFKIKLKNFMVLI